MSHHTSSLGLMMLFADASFTANISYHAPIFGNTTSPPIYSKKSIGRNGNTPSESLVSIFTKPWKKDIWLMRCMKSLEDPLAILSTFERSLTVPNKGFSTWKMRWLIGTPKIGIGLPINGLVYFARSLLLLLSVALMKLSNSFNRILTLTFKHILIR